MKFGIDNYLGTWTSKDGFKLEIFKVDATSALVSFYSPDGSLISRPYFNNKPTTEMPASYDDYYGEFSVYLWEKELGFVLDLHLEEEYELDQFREKSLVPSLIRFEEDAFLDQYYKLFGNLKHFNETNTQRQYLSLANLSA